MPLRQNTKKLSYMRAASPTKRLLILAANFADLQYAPLIAQSPHDVDRRRHIERRQRYFRARYTLRIGLREPSVVVDSHAPHDRTEIPMKVWFVEIPQCRYAKTALDARAHMPADPVAEGTQTLTARDADCLRAAARLLGAGGD